MTEVTQRNWRLATLSAGSGALLGLYVAVLGPLLVAFLKNDDPIHRGHYFEWGTGLMMTAIPIGAAVLASLSWVGRCPVTMRVVRWLGLVLACLLIIYLSWTGL